MITVAVLSLSSSADKAGTRGLRLARSFPAAASTRIISGTEAVCCWNCKFLSTVTKASNCCDASASSRPFLTPLQPISSTVRTSWPLSSRANRRGTHSSSSTRMGDGQIAGLAQCRHCQFPRHAGKVLEKLVEAGTVAEMLEQRPERHTRSCEYRRATHDFRIAGDCRFHRRLPVLPIKIVRSGVAGRRTTSAVNPARRAVAARRAASPLRSARWCRQSPHRPFRAAAFRPRVVPRGATLPVPRGRLRPRR